MHTQLKTDLWIYYLAIVLGSTVTASVVCSISLLLLGRTTPDILLALGIVAGAGFIKLLISPLNRRFFE